VKEGDPVVVVAVLVAAGARGGGEDGSTRAAAPSGRRVAVAAAKLRDFSPAALALLSGIWRESKWAGPSAQGGRPVPRTARTGGAFRFA